MENEVRVLGAGWIKCSRRLEDCFVIFNLFRSALSLLAKSFSLDFCKTFKKIKKIFQLNEKLENTTSSDLIACFLTRARYILDNLKRKIDYVYFSPMKIIEI